MSALDEQPTEIGPALPRDDDGTGAVFALLRQKRAEYAADKKYDVDVPGSRGCLVLRCGPPLGGVLTRLRERFDRSRSPDRDFDFGADLLLAVCQDVLYRPDEGDELRPISLDEPMRIDERLAEGLGLDTGHNARELVRQLFSGAPSPEIALSATMNAYIEWAGSAVDDEAVLGESPAARK